MKEETSWEVALVVLILYLPAMLLESAVAINLWSWFLEPTFHYSLSCSLALGVGFLISLWVPSSKEIKNDADQLDVLLGNFTKPLLLLSFGWLIHLFF